MDSDENGPAFEAFETSRYHENDYSFGYLDIDISKKGQFDSLKRAHLNTMTVRCGLMLRVVGQVRARAS